MTLAELNAKDRSGFVSAIGGAFEESPWVAERAWEKRPFATLDALSDTMVGVVAAATREEQLSLLRAHPDLGAVRLTTFAKAPVVKKPDTTGTTGTVDATGSVRLPPSRKASADRRSLGEGGQADRMSPASQREQAGAGLDALTRDERERLRALNSAYREKFGFPFLYAVKGSTKQEILDAIERRLTSMRDAEHQEALRQVYRIARFRLEDMVRQP